MLEKNAAFSNLSWKEMYASKLMSAEQAAARIKSNDTIALSGGTCIPPAFCRAISNRAGDVENVRLSMGYAMDFYDFMSPENKNSFHIETMFVGPIERMCMDLGVAQYVPLHLGDVPRYSEQVGFKHVASVATPPDENGFMSRSLFGAFVDKPSIERAENVVIEVNRNFPRMNSDDFKIHVSEVDCIIENDNPVFEVPEIEITHEEQQIAAYISELVNDGDTIQLGFGGLANAIGHFLFEKKDLGMHAEVVTPSVMELEKAGVINGSKKSFMPGQIVAAFCVGTQEFYDYIHNNPKYIFHEIGFINDPAIIGKNDNLISINNALMIDLTGQAASESIGTKQYSGTGGQVNFVQGSKLAKNGRSVLALNSTYLDKEGKRQSKIVPIFPEGTVVSTSRNDVQYIVTEFGVANLRFQSIRQRALALISIAHPDFRDQLTYDAKKQGWI